MTTSTSTIIPRDAATLGRLFHLTMDDYADHPPVALFTTGQPILNRVWMVWRAQQAPRPVAFVIDDDTGRITMQMRY